MNLMMSLYIVNISQFDLSAHSIASCSNAYKFVNTGEKGDSTAAFEREARFLDLNVCNYIVNLVWLNTLKNYTIYDTPSR